jgi:DNA-binding MarR family transcriptional regulator
MKSNKQEPGAPPAEQSYPASFLLAQLGAHAASRFAARLSQLELAPAHSGILCILRTAPAITQQDLATRLGMVPSRLVALLDELESRGLTERRRNRDDRRRHAVLLTHQGRERLAKIGQISREHENSLLKALSSEERRQLAAMLQRVADEQGLTRGVHPGYRTLRSGKTSTEG